MSDPSVIEHAQQLMQGFVDNNGRSTDPYGQLMSPYTYDSINNKHVSVNEYNSAIYNTELLGRPIESRVMESIYREGIGNAPMLSACPPPPPPPIPRSYMTSGSN